LTTTSLNSSDGPRDPITFRIIGAALRIDRLLGPGLLESAYEECLAHELTKAGLTFSRQQTLPVIYDGLRIDCGFRPDLVVEGRVIVEVKTVAKLLPVHEAQLLTYLRLSGIHVGLLINFHAHPLADGIKRMVF
jgi:GxxExxY protein